MRVAADFRSIARDALKGNWLIAVLAGLVATILGALGDMGPEVKVNIDGTNAGVNIDFLGQTIYSAGGGLDSDIGTLLVGSIGVIMIAALVIGVLYFVLGSIIGIGYAKFNLNLLEHREGTIGDLFAYFSYWKTTVATRLLKTIYEVLWSLLLIIPGVMASFSYAMTDYILAENPELSASEAIRLSKQMMEGNRWRLFCLYVSFIGWQILAAFTLGIGNLWLNPYKQAAVAAFYREVSETEYKMR